MASIYFIHLSVILQCVAWHCRRKSRTQNSVVGKNGSINLELVKSLFISENEKGLGEVGVVGRRERGKERGEVRRIYTSKATAGILSETKESQTVEAA